MAISTLFPSKFVSLQTHQKLKSFSGGVVSMDGLLEPLSQEVNDQVMLRVPCLAVNRQ